MTMDTDLESALTEAFSKMSPPQGEEFQRRFRRLVENALLANHTDSEVRRVLELIDIDIEGDGE